VAEQVSAALREAHPRLVICGAEAGSYAVEDEGEIARRIREAEADVVLVAYPSVPQETWIARNLPYTGASVGMGVGAAFDFCVGVQARAPLWMQRLGLEWLYRLIREPRRWRRMLALPLAAWLVFWQRFMGGNNDRSN
jgi:N-acetylglucosaminyldiphosphoundecaprenol N-acetyl-beta-D-mannosaminyltransferase